MKHLFNLDNLFATLFVYAVIGSFYLVPFTFNFMDPIAQALSDFELTDIVFSKLRDERHEQADTNIVLVNIGNLTRNNIAAEINMLNKYQPKVIGVDAFFRTPKISEVDFPLVTAFNETKNLVLVSKLVDFNLNEKKFSNLEVSHKKFSTNAQTGFANLIVNEKDGFRTSRIFSPKESVQNSVELSFGVKIAQLYNSGLYDEFMKRNNKIETINYRGNFDKFYTLDVQDLLNPEADIGFVKDKIVLLGYLGPSLGTPTLEDVFFTPLNERYAGKTYPDMYGIVIHANIISMILNRNYIDLMPGWLGILLAFLLCYVNIVFFSYLYNKHHRWYYGISKLIQIVESVFILFVVVHIFNYFNYKIDVTVGIIAVILSADLYEIYCNFLKTTKTK